MRRSASLIVVVLTCTSLFAAEPLKVGVFEVDASPPIGSRMAYDPCNEVLIPLSCRGIVLVGADKPIVLCAVDWLGIANDSHKEFRREIAIAVGTTPDRVAVHTLHQHDAPWADFTTDELLIRHKIEHRPFDSKFVRDVIARAAKAAAKAKDESQVVTHMGVSKAAVEKVASNRRILGPNGKVSHVRWSANKDAAVREFPEGVIDPYVKVVALFNLKEGSATDAKPIVALSYYATHPQSYYRTGKANPDFPGIARNAVQEELGLPLIHFNGASGNVTAGKYNDGSVENRQILADRVATGMKAALADMKISPISSEDVAWNTVAVKLPAAPHFDETKMLPIIEDAEKNALQRFITASNLAWLKRTQQDDTIDLTCLTMGKARVLHMPGELFVEYQIAAQELRPDLFVSMAAYGDYGTAYIGTAISYDEGGYETGPTASNVSADAEKVLMAGIAKLLDVEPAKIQPLR